MAIINSPTEYALHVQPYTPAHYFKRGKAEPQFCTKVQITLELVQQAVGMQLPFRAVVADCCYGERQEFKQGLHELHTSRPSPQAVPCLVHRVDELASLWEVAKTSPGDEPTQAGDWQVVGKAPTSRCAASVS